jgi:hypothetical protein
LLGIAQTDCETGAHGMAAATPPVSNPIVEHAPFRTPIEGIAGAIMTEKPAPKASDEVFTPIRDLPSAPIIFFEFCPTFGNHNGLINIMLAAGIVMPSGGPTTDVVPVSVAHLRSPPPPPFNCAMPSTRRC